MKLRLAFSLVLSAAALWFSAGQAQAQIAYAIGGNGHLYRFDLATPGTLTDIGAFSGAGTNISGIDFRPADGQLYGYHFDQNAALNQIVRIDVATAATTFVSTPSTASSNGVLGLDFNPVADRLRLVNIDNQNLRINVDTGATLVDGTLAFAAGDANFGGNTRIAGAAYTINDNNPGTTTTQLYYIDASLDILATTSNPNGGVVNTVGPLGVNADQFNVGFDIFTTAGGSNLAYAILNSPTLPPAPTLYSIDLATGAATSLGALDSDSNLLGELGFLSSLAITPVPEPGSLALLATGLMGAVALRRRKLKSVT